MPKKNVKPQDKDLILSTTDQKPKGIDPRCKYQTALELQQDVLAYREFCLSNNKYMTLPGLRDFLGVSHDTFDRYCGYPHLSETAKAAKQMIEAELIQVGIQKNSTFILFLLKCSFGYVEKVDPLSSVNINVTMSEDELNQRLKQAGIDPNSIK